MRFTHLQVRSGYSFYESTMTIDKLVAQAKHLNSSALALTDERVLYGAISFYQNCKRNWIKPIICMQKTIQIEELQLSIFAVLFINNNLENQHFIALSTSLQLGNTCNLDLMETYQENLFCIHSSY